ncbi:MAG: type I-C CRISPR-associated endonuclease Cas1c [Cystobacterineae bacterium]|nr:type I-C CRISPR-associated endonuclease Cas1c [Cystobacterineae bacterium]
MRRQLNTVYVTTEGAWLHKDGANLVMEVDKEVKRRLPVHMLEGVVCFGRVLVSPPLLGYCAEQGICVSYLTPNGKFLARVEGPVSGNVLLRREQYRASDDETRCCAIARNLLAGKIHNQRAVVGRALRDYEFDEPVHTTLQQTQKLLMRSIDKLPHKTRLDGLRGLEGEAAQRYFESFSHFIRHEHPMMRFSGRNRRPPRDAVNALLSLFYTLLTHDCRSALETVGLDPAVGFLHRDRPGRPSLALDLAEELRPLLGDRLALSLINRKQVNEHSFRCLDNGAVLLSEDARKTVLVAYQERKQEELKHAFLDEKVPIGLLPYLQSQLLARHLRGDMDAYPPFLWK